MFVSSALSLRSDDPPQCLRGERPNSTRTCRARRRSRRCCRWDRTSRTTEYRPWRCLSPVECPSRSRRRLLPRHECERCRKRRSVYPIKLFSLETLRTVHSATCRVGSPGSTAPIPSVSRRPDCRSAVFQILDSHFATFRYLSDRPTRANNLHETMLTLIAAFMV